MTMPVVTWEVQTVGGPEGTKVRLILHKLGDTINFVMEPEQAYELATAAGAASKDAMRELTIVQAPSKLISVP